LESVIPKSQSAAFLTPERNVSGNRLSWSELRSVCLEWTRRLWHKTAAASK